MRPALAPPEPKKQQSAPGTYSLAEQVRLGDPGPWRPQAPASEVKSENSDSKQTNSQSQGPVSLKGSPKKAGVLSSRSWEFGKTEERGMGGLQNFLSFLGELPFEHLCVQLSRTLSFSKQFSMWAWMTVPRPLRGSLPISLLPSLEAGRGAQSSSIPTTPCCSGDQPHS